MTANLTAYLPIKYGKKSDIILHWRHVNATSIIFD
jgi:hypothetical protein